MQRGDGVDFFFVVRQVKPTENGRFRRL